MGHSPKNGRNPGGFAFLQAGSRNPVAVARSQQAVPALKTCRPRREVGQAGRGGGVWRDLPGSWNVLGCYGIFPAECALNSLGGTSPPRGLWARGGR